MRIANNLGIIDASTTQQVQKCRSKELDLFDQYYEGKQYDHLPDWNEANDSGGDYVPIRKRRPRINYNFARRIAATFASKLVGEAVFPRLTIEDDETSQEFLNAVKKIAHLERVLPQAMRHMAISGAVLIRFRMNSLGAPKLEIFNSKYCYPEFDDDGELSRVVIRYTFFDQADKDEYGKPVEKWYQLELGTASDILYDTPAVGRGDHMPTFQISEQVDHNLGFVQAEWFRTNEDKHKIDGESLLCGGILSLIDEMNYNISQSSQAIAYSQEPQVTISGMSEDEVDELVKSSSKAWNLGRDGKASFMEANLSGVERANEFRDKVRQGIQEVTRVIMQDPEKMVAHAQSGKAMEVLNEPLVDLVMEVRSVFEERLTSLLTKLMMTFIKLNAEGKSVALGMPPDYVPASLNISVAWPPVFAPTIEDIRTKVAVYVQATNAQIISRESALRILARDLGIENIEEEMAKIASQPQINMFGGF